MIGISIEVDGQQVGKAQIYSNGQTTHRAVVPAYIPLQLSVGDPPPTHTITLSTPAGLRSVQVNISGRYTFISLRMIRGQFFPMLPVAGLGGGTPQAQESAPASTGPIVESQSNLEESVK